MRKVMILLVFPSLLSACSSLPSYHNMSCVDLKKNEKSLQRDYKINSFDSVINGVADIFEHSNKSNIDTFIADTELRGTKAELREVQGFIYQKKCK